MIRGWSEAERVGKKQPPTSNKKTSKATKDEEAILNRKPSFQSSPDLELPPSRSIKHLLFVIHGVGQKLSATVDAMSFTYG
jgi:hypothetical protein